MRDGLDRRQQYGHDEWLALLPPPYGLHARGCWYDTLLVADGRALCAVEQYIKDVLFVRR